MRRAYISTQTAEGHQNALDAAASSSRKKHSAARPNQAPPVRSSPAVIQQQQQQADLDPEYEADDEDEASTSGRNVDEPPAASRTPGATAGTWKQRVQRRAANWDQRRDRDTLDMRQYERRKPGLRAAYLDSILASMQQRMHQSLLQHQCHNHLHQALPEVVTYRNITYYSTDAALELPVPTVKCNCCKEVWEISAGEVGCFGTSPVRPQRWFDSLVLDFFTSLTFMAALSTTDFAAALESLYHSAGQEVVVDDG